MRRTAFIHTGAVVIAPVMELATAVMPEVDVVNLLDDKIVADLAAGRVEEVESRLLHLVGAAREAGAGEVMLSCSSISGYAAGLTDKGGLSVLRIDEAMADAAAGYARVAVLATLPTTLRPTTALIVERAERLDARVEIDQEVIEGAFEAVTTGRRDVHDSLLAEAIERHARDADAIVLAQASMASAAEAVDVDVPILSSLGPGVERLAAIVRERPATNC